MGSYKTGIIIKIRRTQNNAQKQKNPKKSRTNRCRSHPSPLPHPPRPRLTAAASPAPMKPKPTPKPTRRERLVAFLHSAPAGTGDRVVPGPFSSVSAQLFCIGSFVSGPLDTPSWWYFHSFWPTFVDGFRGKLKRNTTVLSDLFGSLPKANRPCHFGTHILVVLPTVLPNPWGCSKERKVWGSPFSGANPHFLDGFKGKPNRNTTAL